jgi:hypothetical protein
MLKPLLAAIVVLVVGCGGTSAPVCPANRCIDPPSVTVHVVDASNQQPITNANVTAVHAATNLTLGACMVASPGCFSSGTLPDGTFTVSASTSGYVPGSAEVPVSADSCGHPHAQELTLALAPQNSTAAAASRLVAGAKACGQD